MSQNLQLCFAVIVFLIAIRIGSAADNESSVDQITVKADRLELDRNTGLQKLSGNVVVTRGDISITGDSIQITTQNGAISRIFGTGQPIRFRQRLANGQIVETESNEIDYPTRTWTLVFRGNVILRRDDWQLKGQLVEYNIRNKNFAASGGSPFDLNTASVDSRVSITYNRQQ